MRIVGYTPPTEEEAEALARPVKVDRWYDRSTRSWVVQSLNFEGDQIGDATYVHHKSDAIRDEKARKEEIEKARAAIVAAKVAELREAVQ